jgi:hypothetical protein
MKWLVKFLPKDTRELIELGQRIIGRLDTSEERSEVVRYGIEMFKDGRVEVGEWARFGSKLGVLRGPGRPPKQPSQAQTYRDVRE